MKPNENITIHKRIMHMLYVIHYIMSNDDMTEFSANALEILQSWTEPSILPVLTREHNTHIQHRKSYCVVKWLYVTWQQNSMTIHIRVRNLWRIDTRFLHDSIVSHAIQCQLYSVYNPIYSYSILLLLCINSTYSLDTSIVFILQICMIYTMFPVKYSWYIWVNLIPK